MRIAKRIRCLAIAAGLAVAAMAETGVWNRQKAQEWGERNPWYCGVNYIPSNAVNYTAMWDRTGFSPKLIDRELALMEELGMNCVRFVMQYAVYEDSPMRFVKTLDRFLDICSRHGIKAMPIFFDDCVFGVNTDPKTGPQPEPLEGWYAWAWSPSPGYTMVADERTHPKLEKYVRDVMEHFKDDERIFMWDLYNEPTNTSMPERTWPLLHKVFRWAREVGPSQPITSGMWNGNDSLNAFLADNSDIITFHVYAPRDETERQIRHYLEYGRPAICTEWMNRVAGSYITECMPLFRQYGVGRMMWGFVNSKTQTHLPWGHRPEMLPYTGEWQHDLYRGDFTPYDTRETELIKALCRQAGGTDTEAERGGR